MWRAALGQLQGSGAANATASTGNNGYFVLQVFHLLSLLGSGID